jgi:hypothetical protein
MGWCGLRICQRFETKHGRLAEAAISFDGQGNKSLKIGWSDLNNVQEAGQYPFRDGVITVLELEIAIWRKHPTAMFTLMRKNPIRDRVEYVLGKHEFPSGNAA